MNVQIDDRITIKGVSKNNPNHEGRVIELAPNGVYIANMNMPFMGTYARRYVAYEKIAEVYRNEF